VQQYGEGRRIRGRGRGRGKVCFLYRVKDTLMVNLAPKQNNLTPDK